MLVDEWMIALLKSKQNIKCLLYRTRNQITCKMNTAGSIMDTRIENLPASFDYDQMAIQIQRRFITVNRDELYLHSESDILELKSREQHLLSCAVLYANPQSQTQIMIGMVRDTLFVARQLLDDVMRIIYDGDQLKPVKSILAQLIVPHKSYEDQDDFFTHKNAASPLLLFDKTDFGSSSIRWKTSYQKERKQLRSEEVTDLQVYEIKIFVNAQSQCEQNVYLINEHLQRFEVDANISFTYVPNQAVEILRRRCVGLQSQFLKIKQENCTEKLTQRTERIERGEIRIDFKKHDLCIEIYTRNEKQYTIYQIEDFLKVDLSELKNGNIVQAEATPIHIPQFYVKPEGVIYKGQLLQFIQMKTKSHEAKYLVFCDPKTKVGSENLRKIADFADKNALNIILCVKNIQIEGESQQKRHLVQKTIVKPEKDIFEYVELQEEIFIVGLEKGAEESWMDALQKIIKQ
ncbi:Conserved_hypothetical protein [Hexamita inflata]|uniref:Uncharacterized protein n=1 Tax=Hexamita inflata TaxID=28002 RepID=A0AA86P213_9EUKA|nr:Conserved hypothetical protein [Hexamita inflata]